MKKCSINTLKNNERMSTQALLQEIYDKINEGVTEFEIEACGQHDIGGAVWSKDKKKSLVFNLKNPGQRVGAMAMAGTKITVEGSAPADVGWLNSGAEIVVNGDAGDTAAHCAAGGKIFISGRVGTRSGALMKHDPRFEPPQFWVLKNTGSFSFEFMNGGIAVVCGYDCSPEESVLGSRSCVGMVGGVVYVRGNVKDLAPCVQQVKLDKFDKDFLKSAMPEFLEKINKKPLLKELTDFANWTKIIPISSTQKAKQISVSEFKAKEWFKDGLFGDLVEDDHAIYSLAQSGEARLRKPKWDKTLCIGCNLCLNNCPQKAISKDDNKNYSSNDNLCIGCGICEAVCPRNAWVVKG